MVSILASWLLSALAIFLVASYLPGIHVDNFVTSLVVALALGVVNAFIKPILVVLTLPINMVTLGLFTFVINAALIYGVSLVVPGFAIDGWLPALLAAVVLWLISTLIHFVMFPVKAA
ncbi:MAG: phage holin family protein [Candidatus Curtissbacteria bacterium]|nr:phage holin family protein [Candidatus Curtissbacteria bacterium]